MPVAELLERMPATEFDDWLRYEQIEPFGEIRADFRIAQLASLIANVNRDPQKQPKAFGPMDFMPDFTKAAKKPTSVKRQAAKAAKREAKAERIYEAKMTKLAANKTER